MSESNRALTLVGDRPEVLRSLEEAAQVAGFDVERQLGVEAALDLVAKGRGPKGIVILEAGSGDEGFTAARRLTGAGGVRLALVIPDLDAERAGIASFCGASATWEPAATASELPAALARWGEVGAARPNLEEVAPVLPEQLLRELGTGLQADGHDPRPTRLIEALADPETSLFNYDFLTYKLDEEFKRSRRFGQPLACIKLTFDGECSDGVLRQLGSVFLQAARDTDILGRFDRSSFLFLLPGTSPDGARAMADRIVKNVAELGLVDVVGDPLDLSIGLVACPHPEVRRSEDLYRFAVDACREAARSNTRVVALPG